MFFNHEGHEGSREDNAFSDHQITRSRAIIRFPPAQRTRETPPQSALADRRHRSWAKAHGRYAPLQTAAYAPESARAPSASRPEIRTDRVRRLRTGPVSVAWGSAPS